RIRPPQTRRRRRPEVAAQHRGVRAVDRIDLRRRSTASDCGDRARLTRVVPGRDLELELFVRDQRQPGEARVRGPARPRARQCRGLLDLLHSRHDSPSVAWRVRPTLVRCPVVAAHPDDTTSPDASNPSLTRAYAGRIEARQTSRWRKYLGVQLPYRLHLRRQHLGFVLDVGCGVGRNLVHLEGSGIGVDANGACVDACRRRGLRAYVPDEFHEQARRERWRFDAMLVAHVLEHVGVEGAIDLPRSYLDYIEPGGR